MNEYAVKLLSVFKGDSKGGRIVPPSGISSWLIIFVAAIMCVLGVVALAFSFSSHRIAQTWSQELAGSLTLRISAPPDQMTEQTEAALRVLRTTPGIESADVVDFQAQSELLEPWLGRTVDLSSFGLPRMIEVTETQGGPDREGLLLRLTAEAPGAEMDDHGQWRAPLIASAERIRALGRFALVLVLAALVAIVVVSVQAAIVTNTRNIKTLRLIGARDRFIERAFVRRMTMRAVFGAVIGVILGVLLVSLAGGDDPAIHALRIVGRDWIYVIGLVPLVAVVTYLATRFTAFATLRKLS